MDNYVGEQDSDELATCLLEPETRNVQQLIVKNFEETNNLFDIFMGTNVPKRREYILQHSEEAK